MFSKTGQHVVLCSACYLVFFWNTPEDIRKRYLPTHSYLVVDIIPDIAKPKKWFDPWAGTPDTDRYRTK